MRSRILSCAVALLLASGLSVAGVSSLSPTLVPRAQSWPLCC
jgi:hypothetical protein